MSSPTMIDARGISKSYQRGVPVLDDVTLSLRRGEMVALIGASGSGKSTLIRAIAGLTPIDGSRDGTAGTIEMMGEPIQRDGRLNTGRALRARIGVIFQQFNLVPRLSVLTNVCFGLLGRLPLVRGTLGQFSDADKRVAMQAMARVGIAEHALKRANELSGGQQQRAAIARSLVQGAELLIADEPIASLDPASARRVMDLLADMNRNDGLTVFISLHQVEYALKYCPRTIALKAGKVAYDGPSCALTPAFLNQIYGAESEELFLPSFEEQTRGARSNGAAELPAAVAAMKMAIEIERISA
ncbi:MAG: phosphonate ABC transporter ATP-binding protein [Pseudolabrys sp.]|nr:phosphonate ABC transporter ATP-binding protein [Pseudolabrys sp.]